MRKIIFSPLTYLTFLFAFLFTNKAFSQDDIIKTNDDVIKAKVEEVGERSIKYRKADNMDGPLYVIERSEVYMLVYSNGDRDIITPRGNEAPPVAEAPRQAPPEMPVYEQPVCPVEGYLWTPGYWAFGPAGYYWVPGVWVNPPHPGFLWTPCYWGFVGGVYGYHEGYWGEHIGYYGGVNYGFGYGGHGYDGGRWEGGSFRYNTAVTHVDVTVVHTTYVDRTVVHEGGSRASFNGEGGVRAEPTATERSYAAEKHVNATPEQVQHVHTAQSDKSQYASANGGKPAVAAYSKPGGQPYSAAGKPAQAHPGTQPVAAHPTAQPGAHPASGNENKPGSTPTSHPMPSASHPAASSPESKPGATPTSHPMPSASHPSSEPASHPGAQPANHSNESAPHSSQPSQATQQNKMTGQQPAAKPGNAAPKPAPKPAPQPVKKK